MYKLQDQGTIGVEAMQAFRTRVRLSCYGGDIYTNLCTGETRRQRVLH